MFKPRVLFTNGELVIENTVEVCHSIFSSLKSLWKECGLMLEKEGFRLVSKMTILSCKPLWLSTILTIKSTRCTKTAEFLMSLQTGQEATSDFIRAWSLGTTAVYSTSMLFSRPSTESQGFHNREEGQNLCPQKAYILTGWHRQ